jgi:hypothetical protein
MRFKNAIVTASISSVLLAGGMWGLQFIMFAKAAQWATQGYDIPFYQRVLYLLAVFWSRFWWLILPAICALAFFLAFSAFLVFGSARRTRHEVFQHSKQ